MNKTDKYEVPVYVKTIKEIAEEIGVSKQAVFKKINRQPLSTKLEGLTSTVDGRLMVSVDGERLIKQAFLQENVHFKCQASTKTVNHQPSTINQVDGAVDGLVDGFEKEKSGDRCGKSTSETIQSGVSDYGGEVVFLRRQIEQMNEQLLRRDTAIDSLNRELEKEREHNREKDKLLMETLSKLAETQAALAVGQSAEKQKELAETLIEGQQKIDEVQPETSEISYGDFEEEFHDISKKRRWLRRVWDAITGNDL